MLKSTNPLDDRTEVILFKLNRCQVRLADGSPLESPVPS